MQFEVNKCVEMRQRVAKLVQAFAGSVCLRRSRAGKGRQAESVCKQGIRRCRSLVLSSLFFVGGTVAGEPVRVGFGRKRQYSVLAFLFRTHSVLRNRFDGLLQNLRVRKFFFLLLNGTARLD